MAKLRASDAVETISKLFSFTRHAQHCHHATDGNGELVNAYRILGKCDCGLVEAQEALIEVVFGGKP